RRVFGGASQCHATARAGRWHQPPVTNVRRIPRGPAPDLLAGSQVVAGEAIPAGDEQFALARMRVGDWTGEAFARLLPSIAGTDHLPQFFARGRVQRQEIGIVRAICATTALHRHIALKDLKEKLSLIQQWAGTEGPEKGKRTVIL